MSVRTPTNCALTYLTGLKLFMYPFRENLDFGVDFVNKYKHASINV